mmetsp:Transcript_54148/g.162134  ORF Transcript_54148/g.162134 Transcript_54148/m.162134 type:complete len:644 (-) Transcript_54148:201-2132(-)
MTSDFLVTIVESLVESFRTPPSPKSETLLQFLSRQITNILSVRPLPQSDFSDSIKQYAFRGGGNIHLVLAQFALYPEKAMNSNPDTMNDMLYLMKRAIREDQALDIIKCIIEANGAKFLNCRLASHGISALHSVLLINPPVDIFELILNAANPEVVKMHKFEFYACRPPSGLKPGSVFNGKAGHRHISLKVPDRLASDSTSTVHFDIDPKLPYNSDNLISIHRFDPTSEKGMCRVKAPKGIRRGEIFSVTIGDRQLSVTYPKYRLFRGDGVLRISLPEIPDVVVDAEKKMHGQINDGQIPLHVVLDPAKARLLLDHYPEGVKVKDSLGNVPLHCAALFRTHRISRTVKLAQLLLEEGKRWDFERGVNGDCGVLARNNKGKTPLSMLCSTVSRMLSVQGRWPGQHLGALSESWKLLETFCRTAYLAVTRIDHFCIPHSLPQSNVFLMLHAIVGMGCPADIVQHALTRYPQQLLECDFTGRSIISLASSPLHWHTQTYRVCALIAVLDALGIVEPNILANVDDSKRLPLHWALGHSQRCSRRRVDEEEERKEDDEVIRILLNICPWSAEEVDPVTRLCPFVLAAVEKHNSVNTVYSVLRKSPAMITAHAAFSDDHARSEDLPSCGSRRKWGLRMPLSRKQRRPCS